MAAAPAAVLLGSAAAPALARDRVAEAQSGRQSGQQRSRLLEPTPSCDDGDQPTPPQTEGPYFKPNSPERDSIVPPGTPGMALTVTGYVFSIRCEPLANVLLDWWQADPYGAYDNWGYRFRGHQFTNSDGSFELGTLHPGLYPGRTRHLHVKVQAPGQRILTTQLYFPGEPRNETDQIFDPRLLMTIRQDGSSLQGSFDFVLNV
ncbi:dioxygenase [Streptomyces sp. SB3404]|uniref:Dioxygenase n=2 Tax=Streptomyces boncukensis TaxID=2711219 RepID=A0A6G4X8Q3_9ACTN|nr:dioxygenase [Streptomyces boncukensis]NGO73895.1 dioxygenase [Streptomyces boncukensis]